MATWKPDPSTSSAKTGLETAGQAYGVMPRLIKVIKTECSKWAPLPKRRKMFMFKTFIGVLITTLLVGCATSSKHLNEIRIGMDKEEVQDILGDPQSTQANREGEYLIYTLREGISKPGTTIVPIAYNGLYFVKMIGGRVDSYGRFSNSNEPAPLPMSTFAPAGNNQPPPQPSDSYIQTPNAYGPGIHMDQHGQPVQVVPR